MKKKMCFFTKDSLKHIIGTWRTRSVVFDLLLELTFIFKYAMREEKIYYLSTVLLRFDYKNELFIRLLFDKEPVKYSAL
jgi:hypothetical protein